MCCDIVCPLTCRRQDPRIGHMELFTIISLPLASSALSPHHSPGQARRFGRTCSRGRFWSVRGKCVLSASHQLPCLGVSQVIHQPVPHTWWLAVSWPYSCGGFPRTFVLTFFYPLKNKWFCFCRDQFVLFRSAVANWWFRSQGEYVKGSAWWTPHAPQFWLLQLYKQVRRLCKLLHFLLHA